MVYLSRGRHGRSRGAAAGRDPQDGGKSPSALDVIIGMAAAAVSINIYQRVRNQALMRQVFILSAAISAMAPRAAVFQGVNAMPLPIQVHRILFFMAGDAG